jgi:hypothetical protein
MKEEDCMPVKVQAQGRYELFETTHQHRILVLDHEHWFAWVQGQQGELLVRSDADHQKDHTIQTGRFYLVDFERDPTYKDMPHLFLQKGDRYEEVMLPNGLPTEEDHQKKLVKTDHTLANTELEGYLAHPAPAGSGELRMSRPGGGSMANVAHYLRGIDFPAGRQEVMRHARDQDAPEVVMGQLQRLDDRRFSNMAEVIHAIGAGGERHESSDHEQPLGNYDELTVEEVTSRLEGLNPAELQAVRSYEREHKKRKTLLSELDRRLKQTHRA